MGAKAQSQYRLSINLDKFSYAPGEIINGTFKFIYGKDPAQKKNIKINNPAINISIIQYETINYYSRPKRKQTDFTNQSMYLKQLLNINGNPDQIFTFKIQVPFNALPGFEWPHSEKINASVRSVIKIEIKDIKASGTSFFLIHKNSAPLNSPLQVIEKSQKKGIFSGGDILLRLNSDANSFPIYSQVPIQFTIDFSQSKYKIKGVNCAFKRKIKMLDPNGGSMHEFIDILEEKNVQGNMTKEQTEYFLIDLRDPIEVHKKYCMRILGMASGLQSNQMITLMPSIKGSLFSCEYYFKCKAITDTPLLSAINSPVIYGTIDVFSPLKNEINNVNINPNMLPTMEEIEAQGNLSQQPSPPQQQYPAQQLYPTQQQYPPQQITPQYPSQQPYPPPQSYTPQQSLPSQQPYPPQQSCPSQIESQITKPSKPGQQNTPQQDYHPQNQVPPQQSSHDQLDNLPDAPVLGNNQNPSF